LQVKSQEDAERQRRTYELSVQMAEAACDSEDARRVSISQVMMSANMERGRRVAERRQSAIDAEAESRAERVSRRQQAAEAMQVRHQENGTRTCLTCLIA
jgi:hypothetical protein